MIRPIAISISPNTEFDDVWISLKSLFNFKLYFNNDAVNKLEKAFSSRFGPKYKAVATGSGRSALYLLLKSVGIKDGDEVITQAFTCVVVANSIRMAGAKSVFVDVDKTFNVDPDSLKSKITKKTKAVIVQNTFGVCCNYEKIKAVINSAKQKYGNNILLIEDCAHSLGSKYNNSLVGTIGDLSFFSFGRDKVISSVSGGMALTKDEKLYTKMQSILSGFIKPTFLYSLGEVMHPILMNLVVMPLYHFGIGRITLGKLLLNILLKLGILSRPVSKKEMLGKLDLTQLSRYPSILVPLAMNQLAKLDKYNEKRVEIAKFYVKSLSGSQYILPNITKGSIWLRFPVLTKGAGELINYAKKRKVLLGKWYTGIIEPCINLESIGYKLGSCKNAEKYAEQIVNLPTYPSLQQKSLELVINVLKTWKSIKAK